MKQLTKGLLILPSVPPTPTLHVLVARLTNLTIGLEGGKERVEPGQNIIFCRAASLIIVFFSISD